MQAHYYLFMKVQLDDILKDLIKQSIKYRGFWVICANVLEKK